MRNVWEPIFDGRVVVMTHLSPTELTERPTSGQRYRRLADGATMPCSQVYIFDQLVWADQVFVFSIAGLSQRSPDAIGLAMRGGGGPGLRAPETRLLTPPTWRELRATERNAPL